MKLDDDGKLDLAFRTLSSTRAGRHTSSLEDDVRRRALEYVLYRLEVLELEPEDEEETEDL